MAKTDLMTFGALEKGFRVLPSYKGPLPVELTSRDLWNAWNTVLRAGEGGGHAFGGGNEWMLRTDEICLVIHEASGRHGSRHGLTVARSNNDGGFQIFSPMTFDLELENGILVLWDRDLTVREFRGAIL